MPDFRKTRPDSQTGAKKEDVSGKPGCMVTLFVWMVVISYSTVKLFDIHLVAPPFFHGGMHLLSGIYLALK